MSENVNLILAGGGAKGIYQAHVASEVYKRKNVTSISGVSAGALNGAILSQGNPDKIKKLWDGLDRKDVWDGGHGIKTYFQILTGNRLGLYSPAPIIEKLRKNFNPNKSEVRFSAGCVSLNTGEYVQYSIDPNRTYTEKEKEKARKFVAASSAIPIGVDPIEIGGDLMVDGGTRNISPPTEKEKTIAILNSDVSEKPINQKPTNVLEVGKNALKILLNENARADVPDAGEIIEPSEPIGATTDFSDKTQKKRKEVAKRDVESFFDRQK